MLVNLIDIFLQLSQQATLSLSVSDISSSLYSFPVSVTLGLC